MKERALTTAAFFFLLHYGDEEGTNWTDAFRGIQNSNKFMLLTKAA